MEARNNNKTIDNLIEIHIALGKCPPKTGVPLTAPEHSLYIKIIQLIKNTTIVHSTNPELEKLRKLFDKLKKIKDNDFRPDADGRNLREAIVATFDDAESIKLAQRELSELNIPDDVPDIFDPAFGTATSTPPEEDESSELPSDFVRPREKNILDDDDSIDLDWELVPETKANELAGENEIGNGEALQARSSIPDLEHSVFVGWTKNSAKKGGANPPGPFGGVYKDDDGNLAMFKRDTGKSKLTRKPFVRVGKIIGEYVATNMVADILNDIHKLDDPDYVRKYVAQVSLVVAKTPNQLPGQYNDDEIYLKSLFIKNNLGDFWEVAHVEEAARQLTDADIDRLMPDVPERELEISKAKALAQSIRKNKDIVLPKGELREIAKRLVKEKYGESKPAAVWESTLQRYDDPKIKVPSDVLKNDPQLLKQFCEQTAARILVSDFGLHHGNFLLLKDEDRPEVRRLGTIDLGAAFDEFTPDVRPFDYKDSLLEYYKNHLKEFDPGVIYSKEMAEAFILVGKREDSFLAATLEKVMRSDKIPYSVEGIRAFCKRLGMDKGSYEKISDKNELLETIKGFMLNRLASRSLSLKNTGHGLLIENCFREGKLDQDLLRIEIGKHPELKEFLRDNLNGFRTYIVSNDELGQVKQFYKVLEEEAKQAALTAKLHARLAQVEGLHNELVNLKLQLNHPLSSTTEKTSATQTAFTKLLASTLDLIDKFKRETEASIVSSNNESHKAIYKRLLSVQGAIEELSPAKPVHASKPTAVAMEPVQMQPVEPEPVVDVAARPEASVLTLAMLGTNEHRSHKTILTELIDSIEVSPNQFAHLIDGPGGSGGPNHEHPMLGTYEFKYDENGLPTKPPLGKSETLQQVKGLLTGDGFEDAIIEAKQVIKRLIDTGHKPLTLNLAGFSRGADNILRLSNELNAIYTRDELIINIFAIDPVPGPKRQLATRARIIPELVQDYVAVLQRDESRSVMEVQAKSHLVRQNPSMTTQTYHLYHGPHTAGNYLDDISANEALNPEKHHTTRLVYDDLSKFALAHGVKLRNGMKSLNHVVYGAEKSAPSKALSEGERFYLYNNMLTKHQQDTQKHTVVQREFVSHLSDYFLHGKDYFINTAHMLSFQKRFPNFFDHFFQQGQQFRGENEHWDKVVANVRDMRKYPNLIESLNTYFHRAGINNIPLTNLEALAALKAHPPAPLGIVLIATEFYPDSELLKLWEAVQSAIHPVRIGYDTSTTPEKANALHDEVLEILINDHRTPAAKINAIAGLIDEQLHAAKYIPSVYNHKLAGILEYLGKANEKLAALGPASRIESELARLKKETGIRPKFKVHHDIVNALQAALHQAREHGLHHDTELMNQLLNTALRAMNTLRHQGDPHALGYEKFFRGLILDISTNTPPMEKTLEQQHQATIIKNQFIEDASLLVRKPDIALEAEATAVKKENPVGIEMVEVVRKKTERAEPPRQEEVTVNAAVRVEPDVLTKGADLLAALEGLDRTMQDVNATMSNLLAALNTPKVAVQSKWSQSPASQFYHPLQPEHAAEKLEDQEHKRGKNLGKNPTDK
jgi:hypothetical protein